MNIHLTVSKEMTDVELLKFPSNTWNHLTVYKQIFKIKLKSSF